MFSFGAFGLPDYARVDLAFQDHSTFKFTSGASPSWQFNVPGDRFVIPISVKADFATDATAGTRRVGLAIADQDNVNVVTLYASALQNPSTTIDYQWVAGIDAVYSIDATHLIMPFPDDPIYPGYSLSILGFLSGSDGPASSAIFRYYHIPTGPTLYTSNQVKTITPVLV